MQYVVQLAVTGTMMGVSYGLVALGLALVFKSTGLLNFSHGVIVVLGAILSRFFREDLGMPLPPALLLVIICTVLVFVFMERVCIYPARGMPPLVAMLTLLFVGIAIEGALHIVAGGPKGVAPFSEAIAVNISSVVVSTQYLWVAGIGAVVLLAFTIFFRRTMWGLAMMCTADNPIGGQTIGISPVKVTLIAMVMAGALAGIVGTAIAPIVGARPEIAMALTLKGFAAAILGGLNNLPGVVAGGVLLGILEALVRGLWITELADPLVFLLIIVCLVVRPWGLFGHPESERSHF